MPEDRYIFVVMDSAGGPTKRYGVSKRLLRRATAFVCLVLALSGLVVVHAFYSHDLASNSREVARENDQLTDLLQQHKSLVRARSSDAAQVVRTALQVFKKAGLEREASLLAAGPIQRDDTSTKANSATGVADPSIKAPKVADFDARRIKALNDSLDHLVEYFRDADRLLLNTPAINPSPAGWLTSKYGMRIHPVHGKRMMHKGQDIAGPVGLKVFAPADGVVIWAANRGGYGKTIVLDHGYGLQTHFAHLDAYKVKVGDRVRRSDLIGLMGNTGISTGPHLHYEVRRHGRPLDPMDFILD